MKQLTDPLTTFDRSITLVPRDSPDEFDVDLDAGWASLIGVHGGYMTALAVRAAEQAVPDRPVRTLTTTFLRAGRIGPATVSARRLRHGRSTSIVAVDLSQNGTTIATTRLTLLAPSDGTEWLTPVLADLPAPEDCVPLEPPTEVIHFAQAVALIDPASLPFTGGEQARVSGYFRPLEPRPIDAAWLAMAVDWFPPPAFVRVDPPTGGISVDLTTHIHRARAPLAPGEWLKTAFEVTNSTGGLAVEHGLIADSHGTPLAESFHTRWTAQARRS